MGQFRKYRIFDHTADLGLEIYGHTIEELFANAAYALSDVTTNVQSVASREERALSIDGSDRTDVFVNFLREILYLINGEGLVLKTCRIDAMTPHSVTATVVGEAFVSGRHVVKAEIKAITYHQAEVLQTETGWKGRVICDV